MSAWIILTYCSTLTRYSGPYSSSAGGTAATGAWATGSCRAIDITTSEEKDSLRHIQRLRPQGHQGHLVERLPRGEGAHGLRREAVEGRGDLGQRADPAEVEPVGGERAGAAHGRFLLHDERAFQPRPHHVQLLGLDPV